MVREREEGGESKGGRERERLVTGTRAQEQNHLIEEKL